jgi:hypothetical protein
MTQQHWTVVADGQAGNRVRLDIEGLIDYLEEGIEEWSDETEEWGQRCVAWIRQQLEGTGN